MEKNTSIMPLRMIRIAKDLNMEQMAEYFLVTKAYIRKEKWILGLLSMVWII